MAGRESVLEGMSVARGPLASTAFNCPFVIRTTRVLCGEDWSCDFSMNIEGDIKLEEVEGESKSSPASLRAVSRRFGAEAVSKRLDSF